MDTETITISITGTIEYTLSATVPGDQALSVFGELKKVLARQETPKRTTRRPGRSSHPEAVAGTTIEPEG